MLLRWLVIIALGSLLWRWLSKTGRAIPQGQSGPGPNPAPDSEDPYEVLGVSRGAARDEIRAAYQRKVQQYHPDRVADMGPELQTIAEAKTKELNAAYSELKKVWS